MAFGFIKKIFSFGKKEVQETVEEIREETSGLPSPEILTEEPAAETLAPEGETPAEARPEFGS